MDIFAAALTGGGAFWEESPSLSDMAPSQASLTDSQSSGATDMVTIDLIDDDDTCTAATHADVQRISGQSSAISCEGSTLEAPSQEVHADTSRKRPAAPGDQPPKQKRAARNMLTLTQVEQGEAEDLTCVFVERDTTKDPGTTKVPVPLWNQYRASWRDADFGNAKWIIVSSYERWVMQMVDAVTTKAVRPVAKAFSDKFRIEFLSCLATARRPTALENPLDDSDDEDGSQPSGARCRGGLAVLQVNIGGFDVLCLNHVKRIALKLDMQTCKFISAWVVPLARRVALSQDETTASPDSTASESSHALAGFNFSASPTPNIRDKVQWNPMSHCWQILVKNPKTEVPASIHVDSSLPAALYAKEKIAAYHRATEVWNSTDGSKRFRIPVVAAAASSGGD